LLKLAQEIQVWTDEITQQQLN